MAEIQSPWRHGNDGVKKEVLPLLSLDTDWLISSDINPVLYLGIYTTGLSF